jgi:cyclohexyl-isocyanide hydratase
MTQLDFTGPFEVFARLPKEKIHVLWKTIEPVVSDTGLTLLPTTTLEDCPELDLSCIPCGVIRVMPVDKQNPVKP